MPMKFTGGDTFITKLKVKNKSSVEYLERHMNILYDRGFGQGKFSMICRNCLCLF